MFKGQFLYFCKTLVRGSAGPIGRDVDTLVLAMRSLLVPYMFQLDTSVPPIPFREEVICV